MADRTLISGAAAVAQSEGVGKLATAEMWQDSADFIGKGVGDVVQARNREFNRILSNQLSQEGLTEEDKDSLYKELEKERFGYVYLNRRRRIKAEQDLDKKAKDIVVNEAARDEIANSASKTTIINVPDSMKRDISTILQNKYPQIEDQNGNKGRVITDPNSEKFVYEFSGDKETDITATAVDKFYQQYFNVAEEDSPEKEFEKRTYREIGPIDVDNLPEGLQFVTDSEYIDMINSYAPDESSINDFQNHIDKTMKDAGNKQSGENIDFKWDLTYNKMKTFTANGNMKSIAQNNILGDRNFEQDLIAALSDPNQSSYELLGINMTKDQAKLLDPTEHTPITPSDAKEITKEIINNNPELLSKMLSGFLTSVTEEIYYKSLNFETIRDNPGYQAQMMTPEQADSTTARIEKQKEQLRGGVARMTWTGGTI